MKKSVKTLLCVLCVALMAASSVLFVACSDPEPVAPGTSAECGEYYCDTGTSEYTLMLADGNSFRMNVYGDTLSGSYTLTGEDIAFSFASDVTVTVSATYKGTSITLRYGDSVLEFLKKINYTVKFDSNGGSAVADATVVNGKTVAKPADPSKSGQLFVGWYADSVFSRQYMFASKVTGDITLYARWTDANDNKPEVNVSFDLNYTGAVNDLPVLTTVGGKIFDVPTPERDGYTFAGWWISAFGAGDKLTRVYNENTVFDAAVTLFAEWTRSPAGGKLAAPLASVTDAAITWAAVPNATGYKVVVTDPEGDVEEFPRITSVTLQYPFDRPGEYTIEVYALAPNSANDSDARPRSFLSKALAKASGFTVTDKSLNWTAVPNATKYVVSVNCGDEFHTHDATDNGSSTQFSFANCPLKEGVGIVFTVKAQAEGYFESSAVYTYAPKLAAVTGLIFNATNSTVSWNEAENAAEYRLDIECEDDAHNHESVTTEDTSYSMAGYTAHTMTVKVTPVNGDYLSPEATALTLEKRGLAVPAVTLSGNSVNWTAVESATEYEVYFGGEKVSVAGYTGLTYDLASLLGGIDNGADCTVRVVAKSAAGDSEAAVTAKKGVVTGNPTYKNGTLSWQAAFGVSQYTVTVNGETFIANSNSLGVTLTRKGTNTLTVTGLSGTATVSTTVTAYEISFNANGGTGEPDSIFMATGDTLKSMPTTSKQNYNFAVWYNSPDGASGNGKRYENGGKFGDSADVMLYASYTPREFYASYVIGSTVSTTQTSKLLTYGEDFTLEIPTNTNNAVVFNGWYTRNYGRGTRLTDENGVSVAPWAIDLDDTDTVKVYPLWESVFAFTKNDDGADTYSVSFRTNSTITTERLRAITDLTVPAVYTDLGEDEEEETRTVTRVIDLTRGTSLVNVTIPNTVSYISSTAFGATENSNLKSITVSDNNANNPKYFSDDGVLYSNGNNNEISVHIVPFAKTGSYTVKDKVTSIGNLPFANSKLESITLPATVTYVSPEAFKNNTELTTFTVLDPASNTGSSLTIGKRAFVGCTSLTTLNLPARFDSDESALPLTRYYVGGNRTTDNVSYPTVYIEDDYNAGDETEANITDLFYGTDSLTDIVVATGNEKYKSEDGVLYSKNGGRLLYYPAGKTGAFTVPGTVTAIASGAFVGTQVGAVTVTASGVTIEDYAFAMSDVPSVTFEGSASALAVTIGKYAFYKCDELASVNFADNCAVTNIDDGAFLDCDAITSLEIPASVTSIGKIAFALCDELEYVSYKAGATPALGENFICSCANMTTLYLHSGVTELPNLSGTAIDDVVIVGTSEYFELANEMLIEKSSHKVLLATKDCEGEVTIPSAASEIGEGAFRNNQKVTKLTIGANVTKIGNYAFADSKIATFAIAEDANADLEIGAYAFSGNEAASLTLPVRKSYAFGYMVDRYGDPVIVNTFENMPNLTTVSLPEGITEIPYNAFYGCVKLTTVNIPSTVTEINDYAFYRAGSESDTFLAVTFDGTSRLERINYGVFSESKVREITLPKSLKYLGTMSNSNGCVFLGCTSLQTVTFEKGGSEALDVGYYAFQNCTALTTVEFPSRLARLGREALKGCTALTTVTFTDTENGTDSSLTRIYADAFTDCIVLPKIVIHSRVTEINGDAFNNCTNLLEVYNLSNLNITAGATGTENGSIGKYAVCVYDSLAAESQLPPDSDGFLFVTKGSDKVLVRYVGTATALVLPDDTYKIEDNLFRNNGTITSVTIPASVTSIGANVFRDATALTTLTLRGNASVGNYAFRGSALTKIIFEGDTYTIGSYALRDTDISDVTGPAALLSYVDSSKVEKLKITSGTTLSASFFFNNTVLQTIEIPDTVVSAPESYGVNAFAGCENLQFNEYGNAKYIGTATNPYFLLATVGDGAAITIHKDTKVMAGAALTSAVASVTVENGNNEWASVSGILYNAAKTQIVFIPAQLGGAVVIPDTITEIANYLFQGKTNITSVNLGGGVASIGYGAFSGCTSLTAVTGGAELTEIKEDAFSGCAALVSFQVNDKLTTIGKNAFSGCTSLKVTKEGDTSYLGTTENPYLILLFGDLDSDTVTIASGTKVIAAYAFSESAVEAIVIPDSVEYINDRAFYASNALENLTIGTGVKEIGYMAFSSISSLSSISVKNGNANFKSVSGILYNADGTEIVIVPGKINGDVVIPDGITSIGEIFAGTGIASIDLGAGVTSLDYDAFKNCTNLTTIVIGKEIWNISSHAFDGADNITYITVDPENTSFYAINNVLYKKSDDSVVYAPANSGGGDNNTAHLVIGDDVTSIANNAYAYNEVLETVVFGANVTEVGEYAFSECENLTSVTLNDGLLYIYDGAFDSCTGIAEIVIPASVTYIEQYAFGFWESPQKVKLSITKEEYWNTSREGNSKMYKYNFDDAIEESYGVMEWSDGTAVTEEDALRPGL